MRVIQRRLLDCLDNLRDANNVNKDLSRQVSELTAIRVSLEAERDHLAADLQDFKDALRDAENARDAATKALQELRVEMERRLREKDEEIDSIR